MPETVFPRFSHGFPTVFSRFLRLCGVRVVCGRVSHVRVTNNLGAPMSAPMSALACWVVSESENGGIGRLSCVRRSRVCAILQPRRLFCFQRSQVCAMGKRINKKSAGVPPGAFIRALGGEAAPPSPPSPPTPPSPQGEEARLAELAELEVLRQPPPPTASPAMTTMAPTPPAAAPVTVKNWSACRSVRPWGGPRNVSPELAALALDGGAPLHQSPR